MDKPGPPPKSGRLKEFDPPTPRTSPNTLAMREREAAMKEPLMMMETDPGTIRKADWRRLLGPQFGSLPRKEARRFLFTKQAEEFMRKQRTKIRVQERRRRRKSERTARAKNRSTS